MDNVVWQLPVKQSDLTDTDWIHPKAKFHAFIGGGSVCGKYGQSSSFFETDLDQPLTKEVACRKCLKKLKLL
jgi:hypothetical protein